MRVLSSTSFPSRLACPATFFRARTISSFSKARCFHQTRANDKDLAIFKNSLQRTLDAHRSSNQASIIRRIPSQVDPKDTPEDATKSQDPLVVPPTAGITSRLSAARRGSKRKSRSSGKDVSPSQPTNLHRPVQWVPDPQRDRSEQCPWLNNLDPAHAFGDGLSQLDAEICALEKYVAPTLPEERQVHRIAADMSQLLEGTVPHAPLIIGSWQTGFAMGHSSLDLLLPIPDAVRSIEIIRKPSATRPKALTLRRGLLRDVNDILQNCPLFTGRVDLSIERSRITAVEGRTGLQMHIYCGEGLPPILEYVRDYRAEYPSLRPLYMTVRLILESQGLYGSRISSIGSEPLLMLVVAFLKMNHGRFRRSDGLGESLLAFLRMYGTQVDLTTTGVSVDPPTLFNAETLKLASRMYSPDNLPAHIRGQRSIMNLRRTAAIRGNVTTATRLCLQDPTNYMDDLGRTCIQTRGLQSALASAYERLSTTLNNWEKDRPSEPVSSLLGIALRANFDDFDDVRRQRTLGE
ncbi:hypothetical protein BO70DRAFT_400598 [Aspergillus heteromorphus CBS 117.55]|uniref:Polynucleotide adenylyltransferase n=1 Tax=Aspergillus heteromorphus CBS 117.55 TaxID=1448321 RepID=A0A317V5W8_9EURO|nr:uncharacterized protein BO70DRAFT_400598 [Aspergillus heteromorphus CBS 117.55]PWY67570.1 hypothetical protein BO70DRAFT_400598 [Aspergillus heteromorphus CBS 117.55]